jgi:hypothetical protein
VAGLQDDPGSERTRQEISGSRGKDSDDFGNFMGFAVLVGGGAYVLANWRDMPDWVQIVFVVFVGLCALMTPVWCYQGFRHTQRLIFPKAYARYVARCEEKDRRRFEKAVRKAEARAALDKAVHPWLQGMLWLIAIMLAMLVAHFVLHLG